MREDNYAPMGNRFAPARAQTAIEDRKAKHTTIVRMASTRSAWITSVPGAREITFDALPSSPFPDHLRGLGYDLTEIDGGERILASAVTERFARRADGELEPLTPDSTERVAQTVTHAGIVKARQFSFLL
jgi:hypothetical protein